MRLIPVLLLTLSMAIAALLWCVAELNAGLARQACLIGTLAAGIESRDGVIARQQRQAQDQAQTELALRQTLTTAGCAAQHREHHIQDVLNDHQPLRDWYRLTLPDAAARLHHRPAFASAADYLRWLSEGQQLPDTGEPAQD